jgi:hypothetical protein
METKDTQEDKARKPNNSVENWDCKDDSANESKGNNLLLMYILQSRAEKFIKCFETESNGCCFGILALHHVAYANKILLANSELDPGLLPIVDRCKVENAQILKCLKPSIKVPVNIGKNFVRLVKQVALFDENDDFDSMLKCNINELTKMGYREIDCLLYEAGLKFDFEKVRGLLEQDANPYVRISGHNAPQELSGLSMKDADSLYHIARNGVCNSIRIYGVADCWKDGVEGRETLITSDLLRELFLGAGCQMVLNIIHKYARMNPE